MWFTFSSPNTIHTRLEEISQLTWLISCHSVIFIQQEMSPFNFCIQAGTAEIR